MAAAGNIHVPVKTYDVVKDSTFNYRHLQIQHSGRTLLHVHTKVGFLSAPVINLHSESEAGPIVASVKLIAFSRGLEVTIESADGRPGNGKTTKVSSSSFGPSAFNFADIESGHQYEWRRTHRKELGSSRLSNSDYKLVDPANDDKILAVYVLDSFTGRSALAHIDFMVELGAELELQALAAILGIEDKLRRARNRGSGPAGGGAAAFGGAGAGAGGVGC